MLNFSFNDLFKFIDSYKFLNNAFHEGKAFVIFDWFFENKFNYHCVNIIKPIDELDIKHDGKIYTIHDFYPSVIKTSNHVSDEYVQLLNDLLRIQEFYNHTMDDEGLELIEKIINGYYSYISGHFYSYNKLLQFSFDKRIKEITTQLKEINSDITLVNNHIIVYHSNHNNLLKYFKWNGWNHYSSYIFSFKNKKFIKQENQS